MRLSFHHRETGHELGAVENVFGVATPTNEFAERAMKINLPGSHRGKKPEHGDRYLRGLRDAYKHSSGFGVRLVDDSPHVPR